LTKSLSTPYGEKKKRDEREGLQRKKIESGRGCSSPRLMAICLILAMIY
jgi:hypothetical protein